MAADLHIHVLEGVTEMEVAYFQLPIHSAGDRLYGEILDRIASTPDIWIGEVSWLKAMLSEDSETYVPGPVQAVSDIIGSGCITLTEGMITTIMAEAFSVKNTTNYDIANKDKVEAFLKQHLGKKVFTVSW